MAAHEITGSEALAYGALEAGVRYVTGYPGSPSTATFEALLRLADSPPHGDINPPITIEWAINEKSAFDAAFGVSLTGLRSLVCLKSVGLNVALDSLMVSNLSPGDGGFVILAGDDPGGWGSQNEEDSRLLAHAAEIPVLEPARATDARPMIREAFVLSEQLRLPVLVRITRALTLDRTAAGALSPQKNEVRMASFQRQPDRYNVLPILVVPFHRRLRASLGKAQSLFEASPWNREQGSGRYGVLASGYAAQKLQNLLAQSSDPPLRLFFLGTICPLPTHRITEFLRGLDGVLILEETAPHVEMQVQALAQREGLALPIYGRSSGHVAEAGELSAPDITPGLLALLPDWPWPSLPGATRAMPSRQALCDGCPYIPTLDALLGAMQLHGGRDAFVVTGETGCMVRSQLPPYELLDVKYGMGSSIGLAAGLARGGIRQRLIALSGDSALLHSGFGELIDAVRADIRMLVIVLANQTTALSGGQPHPASSIDAHGHARKSVDLVRLIEASGARSVTVVDPHDAEATRQAFNAGLAFEGLSVVIAQRPCPIYVGEAERLPGPNLRPV